MHCPGVAVGDAASCWAEATREAGLAVWPGGLERGALASGKGANAVGAAWLGAMRRPLMGSGADLLRRWQGGALMLLLLTRVPSAGRPVLAGEVQRCCSVVNRVAKKKGSDCWNAGAIW
jgi:hypothetical protein